MKHINKKMEIEIDGNVYPCRQTMGAMLRFKQETGREATEIGGNLSDMCTYLWCCVASASKHDGKEFGMSLMDFADSITPDTLGSWVASIADTNGTGTDMADEKKSKA